MKMSTRLKKYVAPSLLYGRHPEGDTTERVILLMVDCGKGEVFRTRSLEEANEYHRILTEEMGCTLLPLNECPVVNDSEIVMHYTSSTYKEWCNA